MTPDEPQRPVAEPNRRHSDDDPVLPNVSRDDSDEGWGDERGTGERDEDWYRRERPPHHG